mmetsp:Transcript_11318/g.25757  ORF Transcript_11318/g.25757 Transcript_11318/m.25757 type:complete len:84 (+) Transcript_11318:495-746(+)
MSAQHPCSLSTTPLPCSLSSPSAKNPRQVKVDSNFSNFSPRVLEDRGTVATDAWLEERAAAPHHSARAKTKQQVAKAVQWSPK